MRLSFKYNLTPTALKLNLAPWIFLIFSFHTESQMIFFLFLNLMVVCSPLILWQSSRSSEPQGTPILIKMLHTVYWRFWSSIEVEMPTISRHSLLLIVPRHIVFHQVVRYDSKDYISFTVLVTTTDDSTRSSLLDKLSTVLDKVSKHSENFSISFSRLFCKFNTKAIRFSIFKSLSFFSVWAIFDKKYILKYYQKSKTCVVTSAKILII